MKTTKQIKKELTLILMYYNFKRAYTEYIMLKINRYFKFTVSERSCSKWLW